MALASNMKRQLARRLQEDLAALAPEFTSAASDTAAGDPALLVSEAGTAIAALQIKRREFVGFNIAYELSASAGEGFPEHETWLAVKSDASPSKVAKLMKAAAAAGTSVVKLVETLAAPAVTDLTEANVTTEIANDPRNGQTGA